VRIHHRDGSSDQFRKECIMGSLAEFAGSSMAAAGSLVQESGSTLVDSATFLPFHIVQILWGTLFGIAGDLGSAVPD
jgi:hypothetical protein